MFDFLELSRIVTLSAVEGQATALLPFDCAQGDKSGSRSG